MHEKMARRTVAAGGQLLPLLVVLLAVGQSGCWRYTSGYENVHTFESDVLGLQTAAIMSVRFDGEEFGTGSCDHPALVPPWRIEAFLVGTKAQLDPRFAEHAAKISAELAQAPSDWVVTLMESRESNYALMVQGQTLRLYRFKPPWSRTGPETAELVDEVFLFDKGYSKK